MTDNVFWPLQRPEDIPKNQTNWPTFAPPQWQTFTPPLTPVDGSKVGVIGFKFSDQQCAALIEYLKTL